MVEALLLLSRLSSDVEIDVEVPVHVSPGEVQLLPTYFRLLQLHQEDGDSGGLAPDVPEWAMTWIDPNFWTLDGLMAFVSSVSAADRELVDTVCGVNSPGDTTAAASAVNHAPAAERPKVLRPTRWGRCLRCKLSLRPHVFKSGQRSGEAYYVCAGFSRRVFMARTDAVGGQHLCQRTRFRNFPDSFGTKSIVCLLVCNATVACDDMPSGKRQYSCT